MILLVRDQALRLSDITSDWVNGGLEDIAKILQDGSERTPRPLLRLVRRSIVRFSITVLGGCQL